MLPFSLIHNPGVYIKMYNVENNSSKCDVCTPVTTYSNYTGFIYFPQELMLIYLSFGDRNVDRICKLYTCVSV